MKLRFDLKTALKALTAFIAVVGITGFFIAPPVIKSLIVSKASEQLHRQVSVQSVAVNPFALSLTVKDFKINEPDGPGAFVSFDRLYVNLESVSIFKRGLVLSEVVIEKPFVNIVRKDAHLYNFSDLIKKEKKEEKPSDFKFSLNNIRIVGGKIDFTDTPKNKDHKISDMNISVPFVSNMPYSIETFVEPSFEAKVNNYSVAFKGKTKPFSNSLETIMDIELKGLDIPFYLAYSPEKLNFDIPSGIFDLNMNVSYVQHKDKKPTLTLKGKAALSRFALNDAKRAKLLDLPLLEVELAPSDVMAKQFHLAKIFIDAIDLNVVKGFDGKINFASLAPKNDGKPAEKNTKADDKGADPLQLEIDRFQIAKGRVRFSDNSNEKPFQTIIEPLELTVTKFSNAKGKSAGLEFSMQTGTKETVKVSGAFGVDPLISEGIVEVKKLQPKKYAAYYDKKLNFAVEQGEVDASVKYKFEKGDKGPHMLISPASFELNSLRLRKKGEDEDFLNIPKFSISGISVDTLAKTVSIGEIATQKGFVSIKKYDDGTMDLSTLVAKEQEPQDNSSIGSKGPAEQQTEKKWAVTLKKFDLDKYGIRFEDDTPEDGAVLKIEQLKLNAENITTLKNKKGKVSASLISNGGGTIKAAGGIGIEPLFANIDLDLKDIGIAQFEPYFSDKLRIEITDGGISSKGALSISKDGHEKIKAVFKGDASINSFSSVDKINSDDFLKWKSLYFGGIEVDTSPLDIKIDQIALSDFYSRLIVNSDGSLNVQGIVVKQSDNNTAGNDNSSLASDKTAVADNASAVAPKKMVRINSLSLQGGTVNFSDRHIKPNYSVNLFEIGGRVSGLSSDDNTLADVNLQGKLENYAPLEIKGRINPLKEDLFVDLKVDFRNMELSPLTPYSGKFIGYAIEKGKLSLDLKYLIVKKKLDSRNNVFLDQFTLGESIESPTATKLPVRLAISLLKNRKGEIDLDLPVTGAIDDPKFSIWGIVGKILLNILVKAATSPFALIGAILGGGEELNHLDFEYGSSDIAPDGEKKLNSIIKALGDRPSLKLEIEGHADIERDTEGLRQNIFQRKLKAQKHKELLKKGSAPASVDMVKIEKEEHLKYLTMAYKEDKFPKPRNMVGLLKDLPAPEMQKLMLTHIVVKEDDLRFLAAQRALKVKEHISKSKQVEQERVFLVEPKSLQPEKKEKLKDSRVDFRLK